MIHWLLGCGGLGFEQADPPSDKGASSPSEVVKPAQRSPRFASARCNDGTPFAYVVRPGSSTTWVVNLKGGYFCDDVAAQCADRKRRLTTTLPATDGAPYPIKHSGIFSPEPEANPAFASATFVDAHYCSSDLWLGSSTERRPTTGDPVGGWYFSGRANVDALFGSLIAHQGLDDADPAVQVLLIGTSAGGAGVVGNLDSIRALLPAISSSGRLKLLLDGSWVPRQPDGVALPNAARWGPVHGSCDADQRAAGHPPAHCIYGDTWWPYLRDSGVPVLVLLSGLDTSQTPVFGVRGPAARQAWLARTHDSLSQVPWVYSRARAYHVVAISPSYRAGAPGPSAQGLVERFWKGGPPEQVFVGYPDDAAVNGGTPGR